MKTADIRQRFLDFFERYDHAVVPSSPLVPGNDPTLLFTNAGMVQFKDVFLGKDKRNYKRAVTAQRCVRAGGKHNDLENVGYTARHHTFFEMLGNFSFGDYFKEEAIEYAWSFVTEELGISPDKLWITVHESDDEAAGIWTRHIGVDPARCTRLTDDNFWQMGDTGPCGPCTEIFYDHGPALAGSPPGSPEPEGDRYVEIWNLVFMQFDRDADGNLNSLPAPSVDTGMGLERTAAVMQGVHSNYETDAFTGLLTAAAELARMDTTDVSSLRVIADHIRACSFMIVDGVLPSREGRGYVLRRIIRRAIRHGYKLGLKEPFFHKLVGVLDSEMGAAYPELRKNRAHVERVLAAEEARFAETLDQGMRLLGDAMGSLHGSTIPGRIAFKLHDTYGFPIDLTQDIAREANLAVDLKGFRRELEVQRARARAASRFDVDLTKGINTDQVTAFTGYNSLVGEGTVVEVFKNSQPASSLEIGEDGVIVLDTTPFYAESGGQVGDVGALMAPGTVFTVKDTQKAGKAHLHLGTVEEGALKSGDVVRAQVDATTRQETVLNHSATHLLHAALRHVLGEHVMQKGSLVAPDRLRFDFSHMQPVSRAELDEIEQLVNDQIRSNAAANDEIMEYDEAIKSGALAFFGDKYDDRVRVMRFGDFSVELCGGTHVRRIGDIGFFKIISESGIAAGVRRIEAVTGPGALAYVRDAESRLARVASLVKGSADDAEEKVAQLVERNKALERELGAVKGQMASAKGDELVEQSVDVGGVQVIAARLDGADVKTLRETVDKLKDKLGSGVVVLSAVEDGKVRLVAGVTKDQTKRVKAGELVNAVAVQVGGKGGGRADMAQAGGTQPELLDKALATVPDWVREQLAA